MIDYSIFYRRVVNTSSISSELAKHDFFISAYNLSERVGQVFLSVQASQKIWLVHPEYGFSNEEIPAPIGSDLRVVVPAIGSNEQEQVLELFKELGDIKGARICIDITGFMGHVICFIMAKLEKLGVDTLTILYAEPTHYLHQENTVFSNKTSGKVRTITGMAGSNSIKAPNFLLLGVGYDHKLISQVIDTKEDSIIYPIFAFPSLSPDFYQQSVMSAAESGKITERDDWVVKRRFAPANDPFSTAQVISETVRQIDKETPVANIYLSPLSTKAQVLGFVLYWLLEGCKREDVNEGGVSIILPECLTYQPDTSRGFKRLWEYTVEFS